ncbi:hypothetical protein IQE94_05525 [Synechocystis sp. PCC 7339]|uniref:discoidin domain-containing protein n=1 Tax=Synechocystis sp. PCC 7339 TaxID=2782213 RepID=UPI001CC05788|nr:discoidin domain-containing protein [Synechocystis sp. PCC 7339]UAJ73742.1 hypothetical protein IQE94_05525 [Synechocystis sp. PCC 7339]
MSRFADQLPIVTEPTPGNYLLGTDENDPKALVRIPAEGLGNGGGSTEYTIFDETALDVDSNVALSAGLYLYAGNSHANFDLSGLNDGDRIEIINATNYKVFLFGFNSWIRQGTNILPINHGLILQNVGIIGVKYGENLILLNALPSSLESDWRIGFIPPQIERTYVSPGDTNGIIYWLGATKYNASFVSPHIRGDITATASSIQDGGRTPDKAFTRGNNGGNGCWHGQATNTGWLRIQFNNNKKARVNSFELWSSDSHALSSFMGANCLFQASNNGTDWQTLLTFFPNVGAGARYFSGVFANDNVYSYYRFYSPINNYHVIGDVELYGGMEI